MSIYVCPGCKKESFIPPNCEIVETWCTCGYGVKLIAYPLVEEEEQKEE